MTRELHLASKKPMNNNTKFFSCWMKMTFCVCVCVRASVSLAFFLFPGIILTTDDRETMVEVCTAEVYGSSLKWKNKVCSAPTHPSVLLLLQGDQDKQFTLNSYFNSKCQWFAAKLLLPNFLSPLFPLFQSKEAVLRLFLRETSQWVKFQHRQETLIFTVKF